MGLLKSHLLVAGRNMLRHKFFSFINVLGLSCAIAFVFLAFLFIRKERSYDRFHRNKDSIYRVYHNIIDPETGQSQDRSAVTAIPLAKDLATEIPAITGYSRYASSTISLRKDDEPYDETIHFVDPGFLDIFDFPLLKGHISSALDEPSDIVLSKEMAEKYFGGDDPVGQDLQLILSDSLLKVTISGVIDARREYSSIPFDFLMPIGQYRLLVSEETFRSYNYGLVENYIQLGPQVKREEIEPRLSGAIEKYTPDGNDRVAYLLQPLTSIHLEDEIVGNALYTDPKKLYYLLALAILVIGIACVNFITLSTSQVLDRLREIGLRKTLGALKGQLRRQLILESFFICLISAIAGVGLSILFLPEFSRLVDTQLTFSPGIAGFLFLFLLMLVIAWVTGWLQSSVLIRKKINDSLTGRAVFTGRRRWLNESLVVLQFALSIILIIGAVTIRRQMQYVQHKDLGFDQERLLEIGMGDTGSTGESRLLLDRFRQKALQNPEILSIGAGMNNSREPWTQLIFDQNGGSREALFFNQVNATWLQTMAIELVEGRGFLEESKESPTAILVNESLVRHFGWEDPLSEQIPGKNFDAPHQIIGVVKDFHFSSLHQHIEPLILAMNVDAIDSGITGLSTYVWPPNLYQLVVRIGPGPIQPVLDHLETSWKTVSADKAFAYHFVDEVLDARYAEEKRWARVMDWASLFAIIIAWLGLLSLMRLSVKKRTKEIGIRKVLGSSLAGVIVLLTRRFFFLVLVSSVLAWPVAWILMRRWLESFNYRIELNPLLFLLVGLGVLFVTLSAISLQSLTAARANPVKALKVE